VGHPLGLVIAPAVVARLTTGQTEDDEGWTQAEAAEVLGVTRGTVAQLVTRGSLDRTADGSCTRASVLARLVRLAGHPQRALR
jgi:excisionase family DNA binding protein